MATGEVKDISVSIIIPTATRLECLSGLLRSLSKIEGGDEIGYEIIVANNAADEKTATAVADIVDERGRDGSGRFRQVREMAPGKCRAQNRAIGEARGPVLAFLDDDVEPASGWLRAVHGFFQRDAYEVMQGAILMPPELENDPEFLRAYHRYRTIDFLRYGPETKEISTLTGANMAMRREVFAKAGLFDERLGPGRSGISEDVEFAQRVIRHGGRIGYEPAAAVYHAVDWSRLTEEFFRLRHEQQGRSRLIYKNSSVASIVGNLLRAVWTFCCYSLVGPVRKQYRAKGRYFHYRAMLVARLGRMLKNPLSGYPGGGRSP